MRQAHTRIGALFLTLVTGASLADTKPARHEIKSEEGRFGVTFPDKPKEVTQKVTAAGATFDVHALSWEGPDGVTLTLLWNDYPEEVFARTSAKRVLENIKAGYERGGQKVISEKALKVGDESRELRVDPGKSRTHRVVLVMQGRRLYQLLTYAPEAKPSEDVTQAFLDSFALINTK